MRAIVAYTLGDPGGGIEQYQRGAYVISTAQERLDAQAIHAYLSGSYWAESIPFEVVERALRILRSPQLQGLRRWMLVTRDAHGLYQRVGFRPLATPTRVMEIARPGMYRPGTPATFD